MPGGVFCRQCGSPVSTSAGADASEEPTAILEHADAATTQRFDSRPTSPTTNAPTHKRGIISYGVILAVVLGILTVIALTRMRSHNDAPTAPVTNRASLFYPGAQTILDMTNEDGSSTIQLQTSDGLGQVENWYQKNHKFAKTVRLTSSSVIMKNEKLTVTLAVEAGKTHILIKQIP